jgi:hypothetical protein
VPEDYAVFTKNVQDALVSIIRKRREDQGSELDIGEIEAGLAPEFLRLQQNSIWVMWPGDSRDTHPTDSIHSNLDVPVLCVARAYRESDRITSIRRLVGLVSDAVDNNHTLDGISDNAWVTSISTPEVHVGPEGSEEDVKVTQQVIVRVEKIRVLLG